MGCLQTRDDSVPLGRVQENMLEDNVRWNRWAYATNTARVEHCHQETLFNVGGIITG